MSKNEGPSCSQCGKPITERDVKVNAGFCGNCMAKAKKEVEKAIAKRRRAGQNGHR